MAKIEKSSELIENEKQSCDVAKSENWLKSLQNKKFSRFCAKKTNKRAKPFKNESKFSDDRVS